MDTLNFSKFYITKKCMIEQETIFLPNYNPVRPYEARQEELVRAINREIVAKHAASSLLLRLRHSLLEEQASLLGPSLAFINGCKLLSRFDLL